ncbi:MAG: ArsC family reductase [Rhodocyclaceae bacterium]|nr:ArsC family reductase [Rhodocyclaceae bacterium]
MKIYGIRNCDTMKKAFAWLDEHGVDYEFHDYKKLGIDSARLHAWCKVLGWRTLVNTRGTTWRRLSDEQKAIETQSAAVQLMKDHTSLICRPVVETDSGHLLVGFSPITFNSFVARKDAGA